MTAMSTTRVKKRGLLGHAPQGTEPVITESTASEIVALINKNLFYMNNFIKKIKVRLCNICPDKKYLVIADNSLILKKMDSKQFLSGQKLLSIGPL